MLRFLLPLLVLAVIAPVQAQSPRDMVILPWQAGTHFAETLDDLYITANGHTRGTDLDTSIFYWNSYGRIRLNRHNPDPQVMIGYQILALSVSSDLQAINGDFFDLALAGGYKFDECDNGWRFSVIGGLGTANDNHFRNSDSLYGLATVNAAKTLDEKSALNLGLQYDGNRVVFPDIPLPYGMYTRRANDQLFYGVGFPVNFIRWHPLPALGLRLSYTIPAGLGADVAFWLRKNICLFIAYDESTDTFHIDDQDNRRLFYQTRRGTAGLRLITKWADLSLGAGYAFDQKFRSGFDLRDTTNVARLSDEPFLALKIRGTF